MDIDDYNQSGVGYENTNWDLEDPIRTMEIRDDVDYDKAPTASSSFAKDEEVVKFQPIKKEELSPYYNREPTPVRWREPKQESCAWDSPPPLPQAEEPTKEEDKSDDNNDNEDRHKMGVNSALEEGNNHDDSEEGTVTFVIHVPASAASSQSTESETVASLAATLAASAATTATAVPPVKLGSDDPSKAPGKGKSPAKTIYITLQPKKQALSLIPPAAAAATVVTAQSSSAPAPQIHTTVYQMDKIKKQQNSEVILFWKTHIPNIITYKTHPTTVTQLFRAEFPTQPAHCSTIKFVFMIISGKKYRETLADCIAAANAELQQAWKGARHCTRYANWRRELQILVAYNNYKMGKSLTENAADLGISYNRMYYLTANDTRLQEWLPANVKAALRKQSIAKLSDNSSILTKKDGAGVSQASLTRGDPVSPSAVPTPGSTP